MNTQTETQSSFLEYDLHGARKGWQRNIDERLTEVLAQL
jgi:hypothetical protein